MTWTLDNSGTTTLTGGGTTDNLVASNTNNGSFCFQPDLVNMANGDIIEFEILTKVLSGGTFRRAWKCAFANVQNIVAPPFPPIPSDIEIKVTAKQSAGTGRSVPWKLLRI